MPLRLTLLLSIALLCSSFQPLAKQLLREPSLQGNTLVFSYANDIWMTSLNGGEAKRLTNFQGREYQPKLSPNGNLIAFSGEYAGNTDVYIVNVNGGPVTRLTYHPSKDEAVGWSPDGQSVLFRTTRNNAPRSWDRLYTVPVNGGNPSALPMNRAYNGAFNASGDKVVFRRPGYWDKGWRNYRGGQNQALRIIDLNDLSEQDLPFENEANFEPVWHGDDIYYLSNKSQVTNVFKYSTRSKALSQVTQLNDWDIMSFAIDGENLIYEYLGDFYLKRPNAKAVKIPITINANFYWLREQYVDASQAITHFDFSPNGKRAVFSARGDIFTVPVENGSVRNLSDSSAYRETNPAWSNGGSKIAWFSDESGEYRLVIADQFGKVEKEIQLAENGFYANLSWSPDDSRLVFSDQNQQLWIANASNSSTKIIAQNVTTHPEPSIMASWSPDSNFVAYTIQNENMFRELFIYDVIARESKKISHGLAEITYPVWDENGERLYFLASTNHGPNAAWLDMSTISFDPTFNLYYALVNNKVDSPFLPISDDETSETENADDANADNKPDIRVTLASEALLSRVMPLPGNEGHYSHLKAGESGYLFYLSRFTDASGKQATDLMRYSIEDKKATVVASSVQDYRVSQKSVLLRSQQGWHAFDASAKSGPDDKNLNVDLQKRVNFAQEWQQIFREAWRFQRDYFYVDNFHGADWDKVYETYQPLVTSISHPADLTYLLDTLGGEISVGHSYTNFGPLPEIDRNSIGLLGADYEITKGGVKISKLYTGETYFPSQNMSAPFADIAHKVEPGSYLLAVNGKQIDPSKNLYTYFEGTLGKQTEILIGTSADNASLDNKNTSTYTLIPIANETALRRNDWAESNRRYVEQKSEGKLAYVWIPDTAEGGYTWFNRYFFAQSDKQGVILDERFNHGGFIANYIIDVLRRELNGFFNNPFDQAKPMTSPGSGIWGSQVMLINEVSGSGGDMLPYMFRYYGLGPLVGKRTWGGLVGIWGVPALIDGGYMTAPRSGFYDLQGEWKVENEGVAPDIDVEQWTKHTSQGQDPQLNKAIEEALNRLKGKPTLIKPQPKPPVRVPQS
ncbi:S41 family peptidase [Glaciecola petra]|uniref:Tricorn protease homolog n=1 Tax=Glaciecola petra TaxID=3075602 RepID=A0ABU2ZQA7_9ALTE|nr:S41 family peptidase [Aestuariibacter sp. P117]MDT0594809.1 S41 family peptidase [Aestuariibacter sp. P117]